MKYILLILLLFVFLSISYSQNACSGIANLVYGGKTYHTVSIGNQCWLVENLDIGNQINGTVEQTNNGIIEKYCYNNDPANCLTYGGLYEWAEVVQYKNGANNSSSTNPALTGNVQGICPPGWHIPYTNDFNSLDAAVHNDGNSLKAVGQGTGQGAGTNTSGFSALLSGTRFSDGTFSLLNIYDFFVSASEKDNADIYFLDLGSDSNFIYIGNNLKQYGRSVRCLKDIVVNNNNCPESEEFWKNHSNDWPGVFPITIGTLNTYNQSDLRSILKSPARGDASIILADQLIAAKLNIANNSKLPDIVKNAVSKADIAIGSAKIPARIKPNTHLGRIMTSLALILDQFNNGRYSPECRKHLGDRDDDSDLGLTDQSGVQTAALTTQSTELVDKFELFGNYPNPFNPSTQIKFQIPVDGFVTLKIYNLTGQLVRTLLNENMTKGIHTLEWNATNDNGISLTTGIYLYRLQSGNFVSNSKMIYMK